MKAASRYQRLALLILCLCVLISCQNQNSDSSNSISACATVTNIEGEYSCTGECVKTLPSGKMEVAQVSGEKDIVQLYPGSEAVYQVNITNTNFQELEIGVLSGNTLRTATALVSDQTYPVLEEYIFDTDSSCSAIGFTKIVRNPNPDTFKSCMILCVKNTP